ncbi:hypothetical protein D3C81_1446870 [compost metagenome]
MQDVVETVEVGAQHHVPIVVTQSWKCAIAGEPGIQHHAVIGAVAFDVGFQNGFAGFPVGNVELQDARLAPQCFDFCLNALRFGYAAAAVQDDVVPGLCEAQGNGAADATAGAGDQYGFSHRSTPVSVADID